MKSTCRLSIFLCLAAVLVVGCGRSALPPPGPDDFVFHVPGMS